MLIDGGIAGHVVAPLGESGRNSRRSRVFCRFWSDFGLHFGRLHSTIMKLVLSSNLPLSHREALEQLLFFNPRQTAWRNAIAMALERYGMPEIVSDSACIKIAIGGNQDVQCLFALSGTPHQSALAGIVIFLRTSREELVVVHIAVSRRLGRKGRAPAVVRRLLGEVRAAAKRLKGVNRVKLLYREARQAMRPVARSKETPGQGLELRSLPRAS